MKASIQSMLNVDIPLYPSLKVSFECSKVLKTPDMTLIGIWYQVLADLTMKEYFDTNFSTVDTKKPP